MADVGAHVSDILRRVLSEDAYHCVDCIQDLDDGVRTLEEWIEFVVNDFNEQVRDAMATLGMTTAGDQYSLGSTHDEGERT